MSYLKEEGFEVVSWITDDVQKNGWKEYCQESPKKSSPKSDWNNNRIFSFDFIILYLEIFDKILSQFFRTWEFDTTRL